MSGQSVGKPPASETATCAHPPPSVGESEVGRLAAEGNDPLRSLSIFIALLAFFAAAYQAWVAKDTETQALRAYLSATSRGVDVFKKGAPAQALLGVINTGSTPARDVTAHFGFTVQPTRIDQDYQGADDNRVTARERFSIPHVGDGKWTGITVTGKTPVTDEEFGKVVSGEDTLVLQGFFGYSDVFGNPRRTGFCYAFSWKLMSDYAAVVDATKELVGEAPYIPCQRGNYEE